MIGLDGGGILTVLTPKSKWSKEKKKLNLSMSI